MKNIFYLSLLSLTLLKGQFSYPAEDFLGGGIGYSPMYIKLDSIPGASYLTNIGLDPSEFDDPFVVHGGEGFAHVTGRWRIGGYAGMGGTSVSTIPEIKIFFFNMCPITFLATAPAATLLAVSLAEERPPPL